MICFYTGTGNSKYIAEKVAAKTGHSLIDLNSRIKSKNYQPLILPESDNGNLIISVPTYAWRIPKIVENWLERVELRNVKRIWFLMSCGDGIGTAPSYNKKICSIKGVACKGTKMIVMPENYIAMFKVPKEHTARKIIENAEPSINEAINCILNNLDFPDVTYKLIDHIYSKAINPLFYKMFVKADAFTAGNKCTGCGKCISLCPLNNISIKDKKPVWGKNCTHCMACICKCPFEAIEYGTKSAGKPRYKNPYTG